MRHEFTAVYEHDEDWIVAYFGEFARRKVSPTMTASSRDPHRLLSGLHKGGVSLDLSTFDVCFLAAQSK